LDDETSDAEQVDAAMEEVAARTGGTLHRYPRPGRAVRRVVLRDSGDDRGSQLEVATLEVDGTLRISGHDQGAGVSAFFGPEIHSYEWMYVIPADRIGGLVTILGGASDSDVLALLAAYHEQNRGQLGPLLRHPEVRAEFSNWHR
jgi:hypothetical protein